MDLVVSRKEKVQLIVERDGPDCFLCKQPFTKKQGITLDHWIPKSAGGTDEVSNLRLAHKKCNTLKSDLIPKDDSTVPIKEREPKPVKKEILRSGIMERFCENCENGRKISSENHCSKCGSGPGPKTNPRFLKRKSPDCDHNIFWCWACSIGIVDKKSATQHLITG